MNGQKTWTTLGQYGDWIFNLVRTDPGQSPAGISMLLIDMTSPASRCADRADRRWPRGSTRSVLPTSACRPRTSSARRTAPLGLRQVPARQRARRRRPVGAQNGPSLVQAKEWAGPMLDDPLVASRFDRSRTAARAGAHRAARRRALRRRQAAPGLPGAQAQGHRAAAGGHQLVVETSPGQASLASGGRRRHRPAPGTWRSTPVYLMNFRKASIYGGSNEVQRQIIARTILGLWEERRDHLP